MINQMSGYYRVHEGLYVPYYYEAKNLMATYHLYFSFWWIRREENTEADDLSKEALKIEVG
jgi:hypothetical protein